MISDEVLSVLFSVVVQVKIFLYCFIANLFYCFDKEVFFEHFSKVFIIYCQIMTCCCCCVSEITMILVMCELIVFMLDGCIEVANYKKVRLSFAFIESKIFRSRLIKGNWLR